MTFFESPLALLLMLPGAPLFSIDSSTCLALLLRRLLSLLPLIAPRFGTRNQRDSRASEDIMIGFRAVTARKEDLPAISICRA